MAAARAARTVGWFRGWVFGEWAVYQGWAAQALALLERARVTSAPRAGSATRRLGGAATSTTQRRQYLEAIALARRAGDADLECEATASLGMMLVFSGLVEEGMAYLDEALAAICGGGVRELPVVEGCLCGLLNACERTHDVDRAEQWLGAAEEVVRRGNLLAVAGYCRAHYAGILITAGRWAAAEAELLASVGAARRVASRCASRRCAGWPTCACARDAPRTPPCCCTASITTRTPWLPLARLHLAQAPAGAGDRADRPGARRR